MRRSGRPDTSGDLQRPNARGRTQNAPKISCSSILRVLLSAVTYSVTHLCYACAAHAQSVST